MRVPQRKIAVLAVLGIAFLPVAIARKKPPASPVDERARAVQALNRLSFGPRPGDLDHVQAIGVDNWIDRQLHPDSIGDQALEARLSEFRTLKMGPQQVADNFPPAAVIRQIAEGRHKLPRDEERREIYETQLVEFREKQENKNTGAGQRQIKALSDSAVRIPAMLGLEPGARIATLLGMNPEDRAALWAAMKGNDRDAFLAGMSAGQRTDVLAIYNPHQAVADELMQAKVLRAIYSERQLQEVMTDFWMNHFNVFIGKGADRYQLTSYENQVIRPHALGRFEDLLVATAQSPAMLFYLDNWTSVGPHSDFAMGIRRNPGRPMVPFPSQRRKNQPTGLNENYGRELMELHTIGVNGGYTQKDVTEVAKVFTGWTLKQPRQGGEYLFDGRKHEPGTKIVLGHKIQENGEKEGREVLGLLARDPHTAKFISTKLAMRFVSDDPPPALVHQMTKTFLKKDGDIREVLKAMLASPEFWSSDHYRSKVKTPLEFVVSSLRATNAEVDDAMPIVRQLQALGMPVYGARLPTGYSMNAESWVSSSALLGRMDFAVRLASGKIKGVQAFVQVASPDGASGRSGPDAERILMSLENCLLAGKVSRQTHDLVAGRAAAPLNDPQSAKRRLDEPPHPPDVSLMEGLLLGSPEFQRR